MNVQFTNLMVPLAAFAVAFLLSLIVRQIALRTLHRRITNKLSFRYVLLHAIQVPSLLWCVAAALAIAIRYSNPSALVIYWANKGIGTFLIISFSLVTAAVFVRMISVYGEKHQMPFAVAGLSHTLAYVLVLGIAGLMLLRLFDISITPMLTALGVGGLAVALALQDTLGNFFAGVHILVEEPVSVGDFIKLSTGEEGVVRDIGWRTTRIHTGSNNMIVIPNTKITSGSLTNFSMPEKRIVADVPLLAGHAADPNQIAEIAIDVAHSTQGVLEEPAPSVMFEPGVLPTHIEMKLSVHVASQLQRGPVVSAIRAALFERFRAENVPLPSTERVAILRQEQL